MIQHLLDTYGYAAVLLLVALESLGIPLPGETALLTASAYAATGHLSIVGVIAAAAAGAVLGDAGAYWIGRTGGLALIRRYGKLLRRRRCQARAGPRVLQAPWRQDGLPRPLRVAVAHARRAPGRRDPDALRPVLGLQRGRRDLLVAAVRRSGLFLRPPAAARRACHRTGRRARRAAGGTPRRAGPRGRLGGAQRRRDPRVGLAADPAGRRLAVHSRACASGTPRRGRSWRGGSRPASTWAST